MANPGTWHNPDGLRVKFAEYYKDPANFVNVPRELANKGGAVKEMIIDYDLAQLSAMGGTSFTTDINNDGTRDGFNDGDYRLPKRSSVLRVTILATESAAGGTSITVGTYTKAGAAVAATGLVTATEGVTANLAAGKRTFGAGALAAAAAGTDGVGANDVYVAIASTGTFTAGKGRILVEYIDPLGDTL